MKRVLEVDLDNQRVCVEPGVTNIAVSSAVAPDFFYPPDPSSQIVCSIGGNVAENSGGAHCFKYGFTTNYVCGLEVVLPDGELVVLGGRELDPPGYDLLGAFVGSEGTLGIATKVWLRVMPAPETVKTLVAFFDSTHAAGEAVSAIVQSGVVPGAIEMMDRIAIEASEQMAHAGYPVGRGAALLVELDGAERECEARFEQVVALCERCGSDDVRVARDEAERQLFWKTRKAAFPAMGRHVAELLRPGRRDPAHEAARRCSRRSTRWRRSTAWSSPTSSTPATATCTRSSASTGATRARPSARRSCRAGSSTRAWRRAAR